MPRGWLLDAHSTPSGDGVRLWLKEGATGKVRSVTVPYAPPFYVTGPEDSLGTLGEALAPREDVASVERVRIRTSLFEDPARTHPALAVVPVPHGARVPLAREVDSRGGFITYTLYDVDLSPVQTYYGERDLYPLAPVAWSGAEVVATEPPDALEYAPPPLSIAPLEVGTDREGPCRVPGPEVPVRWVRLGEVEVEAESERDTLLDLLRELRRQDPDVLVTRGGDSFHVPHLYRRAQAHGLTESTFFLGREGVPFRLDRRGTVFESYGRILYRTPAHHLAGRLHLDMDERFVDDVGLAGFLDTSRLSRLGLPVVVRQSPGTVFSALEVLEARKEGAHIPWKKNLPEEEKSAADLLAADRGGFILTPPVGLVEGVDEFDFASLFPSLMVTHNLSLETLNCPCCPGSSRQVPGLGYHSCLLREGLVPRVLRPLLARRRYFKRRKQETSGEVRDRYDQLVKAWKWVLVTSFGYQGYRNAPFGRIECHEAINAYARDLLVDVSRFVRDRGWQVVHGIVDSLWLAPPPGGDPGELSDAIERRTGLPLGYEGRYRWIVFLPHARHGLGVANRYYGLYESGELKVRGLEVRRHDVCRFVQRIQEGTLEALSHARDGHEFRAMLPRLVARGGGYARLLARGTWPREDLLLTHRVTHAPEEYRVVSPTTLALRQLRSHGISRGPGEEVSYLLLDEGPRKERPGAVARELLGGDEPYHVPSYVRLLARSFATLFLPFGYPEERILSLWGFAETPRPRRSSPRAGSPVAGGLSPPGPLR